MTFELKINHEWVFGIYSGILYLFNYWIFDRYILVYELWTISAFETTHDGAYLFTTSSLKEITVHDGTASEILVQWDETKTNSFSSTN